MGIVAVPLPSTLDWPYLRHVKGVQVRRRKILAQKINPSFLVVEIAKAMLMLNENVFECNPDKCISLWLEGIILVPFLGTSCTRLICYEGSNSFADLFDFEDKLGIL